MLDWTVASRVVQFIEQLRLLERYLKSGYVGRNFRTILNNPYFVDTRRENQRIDVVHNLAAIIGEHRQDGEFRAVGPAQVRGHVGFRRESGAPHDDVAGVQDLGKRHGDGGFGLGTCGYEEGSPDDK